MFYNYAAAAIRNLLRNRAYAAINLLGLALGFAAAALIALYIHDEYSYNRFIPHADRIYQVGTIIQPPGSSAFRAAVTAADVAPQMQLDFPEVEMATRLVGDQVRLGRDPNHSLSVFAAWADANALQVFQLRPAFGDLAQALSQPDGVVLTRETARRLFGRESVVGEALTLDNAHAMQVSAVIDDWPSNSTLKFDALLPGVASYSVLYLDDAAARRGDRIKAERTYSYVRLRTGANIDGVRAKLRAFVDRHLTHEINGVQQSKAYTFTLTALTQVHFAPPSIADVRPPADPRLVHTMIGTALLIILLAAGNFISMMTARSARRAVEVGVRKAVGATRRQIMSQFMGECLVFSVLAATIAVVVVAAALPSFSGFLQRDIEFGDLLDPALLAMLVGSTLFVGLTAGVYPALVLSQFRPNTVLKGIIVTPARLNALRSMLVIFQFGALIALVVSTLTIHRQTQYAIEERLRLPADQIYFGGSQGPCGAALISSLMQFPGIRQASCASSIAMSMGRTSAIFSGAGGSTVTLRGSPVDANFLELFNVRLLAGRLLSAKYGADNLLVLGDGHDLSHNPAVVINESAVRALGFRSPAEAIGQFKSWSRIELDGSNVKLADIASSEIVGVVADFSIGSVRDVIEPTVYFIDPGWLNMLVLKLDGRTIPGTLQAFNAFWSRDGAQNKFQGVFLSRYIDDLYSDISRQSIIFMVFTSITVVIAGLGLLGLAIYTAERRTKEIGLRKVLGATRIDVLRFLAWKFASPILWANLIAWPCAYLVMQHWLEGFAYHVDLSLPSFLIAGLLATGIAATSVAGHAIQVARAKPVSALRYE